MVIDRRAFLKGSAAIAATTAVAGPFRGLTLRAARAKPVQATGNAGYGPLGPVADARDGVARLWLPEGFSYRSFNEAGDSAAEGVSTPGFHDGMAAFPGKNGRIRLVRNHEINGPGPAFGADSKGYDSMAQGGTLTIEVDPDGSDHSAWVSRNGTQMNCAGGPTPYGTWITCEETINGPDVGNDFTGGDNSLLEERHGYVFEVPAAWGVGEFEKGKPIRAAGRFAHEALAMDPQSGILFMTEDNFGFPSGFYRYISRGNPIQKGGLSDDGVLQMLKVVGEPGAELHHDRTVGEVLNVEWVRIPEPDTTFPEGTSNNEAIQFVGRQGLAEGAAIFSRLEGIWQFGRKMYVNSTQGGDAPNGATSGFGQGAGQLWVYDIDDATLTLLFESPDADVLDMPDNLTISPNGTPLLCEDGRVENLLRGVTGDGEIFNFALNTLPGREDEEFAGATFSPSGDTLFVNIQDEEQGMTYAIRGPWSNGPL